MSLLKILFLFLFYSTIAFSSEKISKNYIYVSNNFDNNLTTKEKEYLKAKKDIKICIDPNWYPFEKISKEGKHIGISSDYFKIFQKKIDIPITLVKTDSWTQTLNFTKSRNCDILTLGNSTPKRKEYLNFTKPYLKIPFILSTKNKELFVNDIKFLKNKKVGVVKNSSLISTLEEKYPNLIIEEVKSDKDGLKQVQDNKIFAHIGNMLSISYILQKEFMNDLKIMNSLGEDKSNLAIGVRNDDLILLQIFNKLVDNLSEETHNEIMNKYLSIKYEQKIKYEYITEIIIIGLLFFFIIGFIQYKLKQLNNQLEKKVEERTQQLLQQNKLVQMGEMISMIAHQWRQPLTAISATANSILLKMIIEEKISEKELRNEITLISDYSQHLSTTIDDFRNFFKSDKEKSNVSLEDIISTSISIVKGSLDSNNIELKTDFKCYRKLNLYSTEINQVILNIIKNSEDALVEKKVSNSFIKIKTYSKNSYVVLEIEDNAGGIKENIIDKVFNPYFSTKMNKDGTGLGLYMSKIIINDHCNGSISVKNSKKGAIFSIRIPV